MEDFFSWNVERSQPKVKKKKWMDSKIMELGTVENISRIIDECIASGYCSLDLETTGLNKNTYTTNFNEGRTQDSIVGYCLSPDGIRGYYIPVRHKKGQKHNLPLSLVQEQLQRLINSETKIIFHNNWFDCTFLQYNGGDPLGEWDDPDKWEDIWILAYLENSKASDENISLGLKALSERHLKYKQIELKDLFPDDYKGNLDFSELDPSWEPCLWYGASDGICTYLLFFVLYPLVVSPEGKKNLGQAVVYKIEKLCAPATRWIERVGIPVNRNKVAELIRIGQREYYQAIKDVYDFCKDVVGRDIEPPFFKLLEKNLNVEDVDFNITDQIKAARQMASKSSYEISGKIMKVIGGREKEFPRYYDLMSRPQLGPLFEEMEIPSLVYTAKSGQVQTTQSEIDRLNKEYGDQYPFLPKISRMGELQTALGTFLFSLYNDLDLNGRLHCKFKQLGTETGRFKTPSGTPEEGGTKFPAHGAPSGKDPKKPECLKRIRECFEAGVGKCIVAIDFASVELRIVTNMSREPKWLQEYFRCSQCAVEFPRDEYPPTLCPKCGSDKIGDLHTLTAIAFYGESKIGSKEWKNLRNGAKAANFAEIYGGGPAALQRATKCEEHVAVHHHRVFGQTYDVLQNWQQDVIKLGKKYGFVISAFGRHYPLPDINLPINPQQEPNYDVRRMNKKLISAAKRNAINAPIQMSSADITKLSMGLIYKEIKKRGWFGKVILFMTIHDELVFEVDLDILPEFLEWAPNLMARNKAIEGLKWEIPLVCDTEMGWDWTVPYNITDWVNGMVREDGMILDWKGKPTGKFWPMAFVKALAPKYGVKKMEEIPDRVEIKLLTLNQDVLEILVTSLKENKSEEGSFITIIGPNNKVIHETSERMDSISLKFDLKTAGII